jgi:hypothetical protein
MIAGKDAFDLWWEWATKNRATVSRFDAEQKSQTKTVLISDTDSCALADINVQCRLAALYKVNSASSTAASLRSRVSKPSVKQR